MARPMSDMMIWPAWRLSKMGDSGRKSASERKNIISLAGTSDLLGYRVTHDRCGGRTFGQRRCG